MHKKDSGTGTNLKVGGGYTPGAILSSSPLFWLYKYN